jgi:hypothetical protein
MAVTSRGEASYVPHYCLVREVAGAPALNHVLTPVFAAVEHDDEQRFFRRSRRRGLAEEVAVRARVEVARECDARAVQRVDALPPRGELQLLLLLYADG